MDIIFYCFLFFTLYVQVFFLYTYLESNFYKEGASGHQVHAQQKMRSPLVSIIVPCFNEEKTLSATIRSLLALKYPKHRIEILIVDDGSRDKTHNIAKRFTKNPRIRTFYKENGGKHTALNLGLENARGELIGCLDADSFVDPHALLEIVKIFHNNRDVMAVTPSIRVYSPQNFLQKLQRTEYNMGIFLRKMLGELNAIHVTPGPFSIFRRTVFTQIGNYREAYNTEDMEMALRMHKNHFKIANAHTAYVHTVTPATLKKLYKQRLRWVHGFLKNVLDYKTMILNKKYGNLGIFSLPGALLSIVTALFFFGTSAMYAFNKFTEIAREYSVLGFSLPTHFYPDWFFFNTGGIAVLTYTLIPGGIAIILIGQRLSEGKIKIHSGIVYFFLLYGIIAPIWIFRAVFNTIFARKTLWR